MSNISNSITEQLQ